MIKKMRDENMDRLMDGILTLKDREEAYLFFEDLCTANEMVSLSQRFEVAGMLRKNYTYMDIAERTGASTATISRVNRALIYGDGGYNAVLKRVSSDS